MQLREYQSQAVRSVWRHLCCQTGNPVIVLPTGSGKSLCIAQLARDAVGWGANVMVLAHRKELLQQNADKLRRLMPDVAVGLFSTGLRRWDAESPVVCAGIQSCWKKAEAFGSRQLILIDEVHLVSLNGEGMYRKFLADIQAINPKARLVGLTATPYRTGEGSLCGPDKLFQGVAYEAEIPGLIANGYLSPITSQATTTAVDTSGLHVRGGEFIAQEVERLFDSEDVVGPAVAEIVAKTVGRRSVLVFCAGVAHAEHVARLLGAATGERVGIVTGETLPMIRSSTLADFVSGSLRWLVNVDVLTTGFDAPNIDALAVLRATCSPGLFAQMCGRGFRLSPGKENCIAEGQRVLTDCGLVPIESVTMDMKVWDGVEFVSHGGVVFRGKQDTMTYSGLTATGDHHVWTKQGWTSFRECIEKQIEISVTGNGWLPVQQSCNLFTGSRSTWSKAALVCNDKMHGMRGSETEGSSYGQEGYGWVPEVREETKYRQAVSGCSEVAFVAVYFCQGAVLESEKFVMEKLWRAWNSIQIRKSKLDGPMDHGQSWRRQVEADRQNRQQRQLRAGESSSSSSKNKHEQPAEKQAYEGHASIPNDVPSREICGRDFSKPAFSRTDVSGDRVEVFQEVVQAKRRVWDILNAGPRHRFTCEGLLVSNCVILDFGSNIERHGPLDSKDYGRPKAIAERGGGDAPEKTCPNCELTWPLKTFECSCGFMFPKEEQGPRHGDKAAEAALLEAMQPPQKWLVDCIDAQPWTNKKTQSRTLRINYGCVMDGASGNLIREEISEWVCLEHDGFAGRKAAEWWRKRCRTPATSIEHAMELWLRGAVALPRCITAKREGRFWRVTDYVLDPVPTLDEYRDVAEKDSADVFSEFGELADFDDVPF